MSTIDIDKLLPHAGDMVLIDELVQLTEQTIECKTRSHLRADNPLRHQDKLPIEAGIEYCAQAMALHSALGPKTASAAGNITQDIAGGEAREGYLAVIKQLQWAALDDLSTLESEIQVLARQLSSLGDSAQYQFEIRHHEQSLLKGQALVVLAPAQS